MILALLVPFYLSRFLSLESLSIIAVSVTFTWFHISLALRMCFFPVTFRGCDSGHIRLGWEGIVPRKARKMAQKSCDLIVDRLIFVDRVLDRIDGEATWRFIDSLGIGKEVFARMLEKNIFSMFPSRSKKRQGVVSRLVCVRFIKELIAFLKDRSVFNVSEMIIDEFTTKKQLLVDLFTRVGAKELVIIERSGIVMGVLCGLCQLILYNTKQEGVNSYLLFSMTGIVIGLVTNWISLFVIFNPIEPISLKRFNLTFHSLFLKRQEEVSRLYSRIVTESVLNCEQVILHLKSKGKWDSIIALFNQILHDEIRHEVVSTFSLVPSGTQQRLIEFLVAESQGLIASQSSYIAQQLVPFIESQIQLESQLYISLINLSYAEFDGILHPVFQEDEGTLIILGGVLGALVGLVQVWLFHL